MPAAYVRAHVEVVNGAACGLPALQELRVGSEARHEERSKEMSVQYAAMDTVIALIKDGKWELGYGDGIRSDGRFWIQEGGLTQGGKTFDVRYSTIKALERRKLIEPVPRTLKQPFWLRKYRYIGT